MEITKYVIRRLKVVPARHVMTSFAQHLIIIHSLWQVLKRVEERNERKRVGKRMILVLMEVLIE